jgi:hypothetical protein
MFHGGIMRLPTFIACSLLITLAPVAFAADAWVLGGFVGPCQGLQWEADALLFNSLATPAVVRLLSVSDGPDNVPDQNRDLELLPRQTVAVVRSAGWGPSADVPLFMLHLDVPAGVAVEGVLNLGTGTGVDCSLIPRPDNSALYGVIRFPHFRTLIPAHQEQIHLGTTLGGQKSRNNVGIYNSSAAAATAHVELRRACDDRIVSETDVVLAPNTTTQVRLENKSTDICTGPAQTWVDYVSVTVDQPSVTWVSTIANDVEPRVLLSIR